MLNREVLELAVGLTLLSRAMNIPPSNNVNVKQEEPDTGSGLCLICALPIRVPGGEPDALQCGQCGVVYHRECAPEWTSECPMCRDKEAVSRWARLLPPGPGVEVVELDGDGEEEEVEEEEEDEAAAKRRKKAARERERIARQPVQRCGVGGCEFQTKDKSNLRQHQACMHGIGNVGAVEARRRKRRATKPTISLARSNETGRAVSPYSDDNNVGL